MTRTTPETEAETPPPAATRRFHPSRYLVEMIVGLVLAVLIVLAIWATVGSVPFIYQGF